LAPLVLYSPPFAPAGTPQGPIADLLRLNTGVPPTPYADASRLGFLANDPAGFPNGRRVFDDVVDIVLRVGVGGVLTLDENGQPFDRFPNNRLGDGVNINDVPYRTEFPYLGLAADGRDRQHIDPGEDLSRSTGGISGLGGSSLLNPAPPITRPAPTPRTPSPPPTTPVPGPTAPRGPLAGAPI
jgi:hypothetical protein